MPDNDEPTSDPWMTLAEIAEELRVNPATVRLWVSRGRLDAMRAGQRKLLVRRSELDRMLQAENTPEEPRATAPADPPWPGRALEAPVTASAVSQRPLAQVDHAEVTEALRAMRLADQKWMAGVEASAYAPPDPGFASRIRGLADAARRESEALRQAAGLQALQWNPIPARENARISYELRPGGNRPGPPELWHRFDGCVERLLSAMAGLDMYAVGSRYGQLADVMEEIADELDADAELRMRSQAG